MAFGGVPIGSIKAKPAIIPIAKAMVTGEIPAAIPTGMAIGNTMATAAALLTPSVKIRVTNASNTIKASPATSPGIKVCASQRAAPVSDSALPMAIAPPYIKITPHCTWLSTLFQSAKRKTNINTTLIKAILARALVCPANNHAITVTSKSALIIQPWIPSEPSSN